MKNITVVLDYQLTNEFIKQETIRLGKCPQREQTYTFLLEAVSPSIRKEILEAGDFNSDKAKITLTPPWGKKFELDYLVGDDNYLTAVSEFVAFMKNYREKQAQKQAEEEKRRAERQADEERRKAEAKAREEAEKAAKAAAEKEKQEWIQQYGSERLKKANALGYTCEKLYVEERTAVEFPGFVVDFEKKADWRGEACPSMKALEIEEAVAKSGHFKPDIVFTVKLTHPPYEIDDYGYQDWQPREAVIICKYLGRYDLVKEV